MTHLDSIPDLATAAPTDVRRAFEADLRAERPEVTRAQLDAARGLVRVTLGL